MIGDRDELITETGLLVPRGEHQAAFLHLSFQEFLAGQRFADIEAGRILDAFFERGGTPEWRNALSFVYGNLLATSSTPERGVRLVADLIQAVTPANIGLGSSPLIPSRC